MPGLAGAGNGVYIGRVENGPVMQLAKPLLVSVALRRSIGHVSFMVAVGLIIAGAWVSKDPLLFKACLGGAFFLIFVADLVCPPLRTPRQGGRGN